MLNENTLMQIDNFVEKSLVMLTTTEHFENCGILRLLSLLFQIL